MKRERQEDDPAAPEAGGPEKLPSRSAASLVWLRSSHAISVGTSTVLLEEVDGLDARLATALQHTGVDRLFPVQAALWAALRGGRACGHDFCVNAPTGSGKTLAYALPLVSSLLGRVVCRLRALVVLPTHDLVHQVSAVLAPLCDAVGLCVGVASGSDALQPEARALVTRLGSELVSAVDVLVVTPGRLVAHVENTPGFTLAHLRFLVVDEADRLLRQSYQNWLPVVLRATAPEPRLGSPQWGAAPLPSHPEVRAVRRFPGGATGSRVCSPRLMKLCLSATLTRDPTKLAQLCLHAPRLLTTTEDTALTALPATLRQWRCVVGSDALAKEASLLVLLRSLHAVPGARTIVFTSSVAGTHALAAWLCAPACLDAGMCASFSSDAAAKQREAMLTRFRSGAVPVLVASDAATRGLDVDGVTAVVSFDAPVALKTYVHRVGRTARAGRDGSAFTLLKQEEVKHFKKIIAKIGGGAPKAYTLDADALKKAQADIGALG